MWERWRLTTLWASTACYRDSFTILDDDDDDDICYSDFYG
jgi:hypothetical protein